MRNRSLAIAAAASFFALLPIAALADAHGEIVTAMTHADLASQAADINGVHMHMHHSLNCLVGTKGAGYDAKEMNPCANAGAGAIPDATDAAKKMAMQDAVKSLEAGVAESDVAKAKADATAAAAKLKGLQ
ncbi:MAG TPA: hypothetical protein VGG10_06855 [Rhizomicrobium sp.]|jgi:hypothetical protein